MQGQQPVAERRKPKPQCLCAGLATGKRSVFRSNWNVHHRERHFNTNANWKPLKSKFCKINLQNGSSNLASRIARPQGALAMKTHKNLYAEICSPENLVLAYRKARKGKSKKQYVKEFEANLDENLQKLRHDLETQTYEPRELRRFILRDPKTRVVYSSDFRDRIVHHALCSIVEPIFEKTFIYDSYANRKGKGTHAALKRFDQFKRKVTQNGRLVKNAADDNMVIGHVLKADIKHYFDTVDHKVLLSLIRRKIKDEKVLWLARKIIENHECKIPGKGMPIGNLTSQLFANIYLNGLDHFVKEELKAKYYLRYMDDFVILHRNERTLKIHKSMIDEFLKTIKLELHAEKSKVFPLHHGVNLLGFRAFYHYKLLKKSNIRAIKKRLQKFEGLHKTGNLSYEEIMESTEGWFAYAKTGNTFKLRRNILKNLDSINSLTAV